MVLSHPRTLRSPRKKERHKKRLRLTATLSVFFIVVLIAGASYGTHSDALALQTVRIVGNEVVEESALREAIEAVLSQKYLLLFSKRNAFLYPQRTLERSLLRSFERLESVVIEKDGRNTLVITVKERIPFGLWCDAAREALDANSKARASKGPCYFLDEKGIIFAEAPSFSGDLFFTYSGAIEGERPVGEGPDALVKSTTPIGSRFMDKEKFHDLSLFLASLEDFGFKPVALYNDGEDFTISMRRGETLLVSQKRDFALTLENLQSFLSGDLAGESSSALVPDDFASIDVRFGNKVFFRRR